MGKAGRRFVTGAIFLILVAFSALIAATPAVAVYAPRVDVLPVDGVITSATADYIAWGIATAQSDGAVCLVILLNTPGGMLEATWEIVRDIANAPLPVVVYVYPRGGRAASAGVYITYAAHIAAMAPETRLGAATPVTMDESGLPVEVPEELQRKLEEDALAGLRALAQERGRNVEWAERAVREAASATAAEALDLGVVDIVAADVDDLLRQIDGRSVRLASGTWVTLDTRGALPVELEMPWNMVLLSILSIPTVAYLLLIAGLVGLWVEFSHPGISIPGVLGGVSLLLGLYGLSILPVNWAGILLLVLGFVLFAVDLYTPPHFVLTIGGIAAVVCGSLLLFSSPEPYLRVEPWVIVLVVLAVLAVMIPILIAAIRGQRRPIVAGGEAIVGQVGVARERLAPEGLVFVDGALWRARAVDGPIAEGEQVRVTAVEGLLLHVQRRPAE